jgi:hypothetical protein
MRTLNNEYISWRDKQIENAFEGHIANAEALKEYVLTEVGGFQYDADVSLQGYINAQRELVENGFDLQDIIDDTLTLWCSHAIQEEDWGVLFQENEPQTDEEAQV